MFTENFGGNFMQKMNTKTLVMTGILGAVAFVLMFLSFSIPMISPFARFDLSALPEILAGFFLGPVAAVYTIVIKIILILAFKGTSSAFTGEFQNFILSIAYVLPAVIYYRKHKDQAHGLSKALIIGSFISIVVAVFTNVYLIFPAYIRLYGMNWDVIIGMCSAVNPYIKNIPTLVAFSVIPFNLISRVSTSIITYLVYEKMGVSITGKLAPIRA